MAGKSDKVANFPGQDMHKVVTGNHVNLTCVCVINNIIHRFITE